MKKTLLDLHKEWCEVESPISFGLCGSVPHGYMGLVQMFRPTRKDKIELVKNNMDKVFWGCGISGSTTFQRYEAYTPLRQTIVLLICAMKGEL